MREKIILQDFTILLVCTSKKWSTIERRLIFDATFLRNIGCNPVLLCEKDTQIDLAADLEDIPRIYLQKRKLTFYHDLQLLAELNKLIREGRYDLVHCYSLAATWMTAFILRSHQKIPLCFTLNQNLNGFYRNLIAKWLLRRLDYIFTLSAEVKEIVEEIFPIHRRKVKNLGCGLEVLNKPEKKTEAHNIGCVINNLNELKRLKHLIKMFRVLKSLSDDKFQHLKLYIFLGPRIYQKDHAKVILSEVDYEFYEGDILLFSLEGKADLLKEIDIFIGTAFDEPLNDFELISVMNGTPVLFPRTAARQSLLYRYPWIGESYFTGDIREARNKLLKILNNYPIYKNELVDLYEEISKVHGLEDYAENLQKFYETAFAKRLKRFQQTSSKGSR